MGAIARVAQKTPTNVKYELLKQYVEEGGGTLRIFTDRTNPDRTTLVFAPKSLQGASTQSQFGGGGTMGHTAMGGV